EQGHDHITLGPLGAYRDFVDVRDVATAVCAAGLAEQVKQPVLNVGSGLPVLIREAVETLAEVAGFHGQIRESAAPPVRSSSVNWIAADLSRINQTLGWAPTYDLSASVQAIWGG
ncbi:MAG TPA: hypothetical protein VHN80_29890, partial [Kineosporiaceae bacterium]|nr:hypothetical protein [Kineosporiaceae bacterium]